MSVMPERRIDKRDAKQKKEGTFFEEYLQERLQEEYV